MKKAFPYFLIVLLAILVVNKLQSLHAATKFAGQKYTDAWSVTTDSDLKCRGDFDIDHSVETDTEEYHWILRTGLKLDNTAWQVSTLTSDASPRSVELDDGDSLCYISGGIDRHSASGRTGSPTANYIGQWGEGDHIMDNYTHLGLYIYNETATSSAGNEVEILITEVDLMDIVDNNSGVVNFYDRVDRTDPFPSGYYASNSAYRNLDGDAIPDVALETWRVQIQKNWRGWKFFLLRLGNVSGTGENTTDHIADNPDGDFTVVTVGDNKFNIREIRGKVGTPYPLDNTDSFLIDTTAYANELKQHYLLDKTGTTLPNKTNHWWKGDVEGLKSIEFNNSGTGKIYIDNVMFTTPNPSAGNTTTYRVDYTWATDSVHCTLYESSDTPLSTYWHSASNGWTDDVNMATHFGSLWYDIEGFIPPTFSAIMDGDPSDTMSRVTIVSQSNWARLLNNTAHRPFFGNRATHTSTSNPYSLNQFTAGTKTGIFGSPSRDNPPMSYGQWYTIFATPRGSDGTDTTSAYGYPQVVNVRFTKPSTKIKIIESLGLTN